MATILFAWELGGGLGHLMQMRPLAESLAARGHRVHVALRHLCLSAGQIFGRAGVRFHQAPFRSRGPLRFRRTPSFAYLLANVGFGDKYELFPVASAWRHLLESVGPDVVLFDHSPTALLAGRCLPEARRVLFGPGFFNPPDESPLPPFAAPGRPVPDRGQLAADEAPVLALANRMLEHWGLAPMERLGQLYGDADETMLATFPELDHFPHRGAPPEAYWGPVNGPGGGRPVAWPDGRGKRLYAYLKPFPALGALLTALNARRNPTVVFADGIDREVRRQFSSPTLRFEDEPLDLAQVGRECDLAVVNANHGTMSQLLLAGRPVLQVPLTLEQSVLAGVVGRLGAGATASGRDAGDVVEKLDEMLASDRYAAAAGQFAAKYADFDPAAQVGRMVRRLEELVPGSAARAAQVQMFRG